MQRVMCRKFDGLPRTATYMDDVGQGATTVREALDLLNEALRRVVINGLKMDLRKCQLIPDKVSFLGYVIFTVGRTLDDSRVAAVEKFEPHRNAKKLYSFLQFANHYRKFIPEFAKVTHKLRHLLAKDIPFVWTDAYEATVNTIKHALKNPLILASFRPDCPTDVHVDASPTVLGAVLSQTQDGKERIIEYASRSLNEHDRGLHSNMLECMALHWAITEKFSVYLRGGPRYTVFTDNFSLSYLVQKGASNRRFASGHSPFRLMHGYDPKLPGELNLASVEGDIDESHRLHDLARGRAETRERLLQSQRKTTVRYDKKRRTPSFITGDLVLLELSARGTLDPRHEGAFEITALVGGNRAEIQRVPHTPGMINQKIVNVEQLRRYKEPLLEVTEPSPSNDMHA
ncbi:hypothetical protein MRX96_034294 [Rhipicephalus microplus]